MTEDRTKALRSLLMGGILPLVIFTFVEQYYGTLWGLVAGMAFGVGEIITEKLTRGRVDMITWIGNGMLIILGAVSLITREGLWFKLQPAVLEAVMAGVLLGSIMAGKPFLILLADKQRVFDKVPPLAQMHLRVKFKGFTFRMGVFFLIHSVIASWAALHWSTRAWVLLKGIGFTGTFIVYAIIEMWWLKRGLKIRRTT